MSDTFIAMELQRAHGSGADQGSGSSRRRIFGCFRTKLHAALFVLAVVICVTIIVICIAVAVSASSSKGKLQGKAIKTNFFTVQMLFFQLQCVFVRNKSHK